MVAVFREVRRVLRPDGTLWLNMGDSYAQAGRAASREERQADAARAQEKHYPTPAFAGYAGWQRAARTAGREFKAKDLMLMPARLAIALQDDGWWLRAEIIWAKSNPLPCSVKDRPAPSHEMVYLLTKSPRYFYDWFAVREPAASATPERMLRAVGEDHKYSDGAPGQPKPHSISGARPNIKKLRGFSTNKAGHSYEPENASLPSQMYRNARTVWEIACQPFSAKSVGISHVDHFACVDVETEALTRTGWKKHEELEDGELIAAYDQAAGVLKWETATFHRYNFSGEMIKIEKREMSALLTPNHRCLVSNLNESGKQSVVRADELIPRHCVPVSAAFEDYENNSIGPEMAALVGWYITEGYSRPSGKIYIYQSQSANPQHVETIRNLLLATKADFTENVRARVWRGRPSVEVEFRIRGEIADRLRVLSPDKKMTPYLANLCRSDASTLLNALIDGDGHRRKDGRSCIIQKDKASIDLMHLLVTRLGYRAIIRPHENCYCLYITTSKWLTLRSTNGKNIPISTEKYSGIVWCPNVPSSFWLARRNGKPFITGNTFPEELARRCITAGVPEVGCCAHCGAPWRRLVKPTEEYAKLLGRSYHDHSNDKAAGMHQAKHDDYTSVPSADYETYGWQLSCKCPYAPPVPATVMDIFSGAGTTGLVAYQLGHNYLGIELNPDYVEIAKRRIYNDSPLFIKFGN